MHTTRHHLRTAYVLSPWGETGSFVCVCFRPIYWRQSLCSRRDVSLCSRRDVRAVHFAVYLEEYTTVYFSVQLESTGVTQEGVNTGPFSSFYVFLFCPTVLLRCLPSFFLSREGFGCPYPSSTPKLNFVYSRSFSAINRFPLLPTIPGRYESEKNLGYYQLTYIPRDDVGTWVECRRK